MKRHFTLLWAVLLVLLACQKNEVPTPDVQAISMATASANRPDFVPQDRCAAHDVLMRQIAADPERGRRLEALERITQEKSENGKGKPGSGGGGGTGGGGGSTAVRYISVVVHVVHTDENIVTDDMIRSQISILNKDFQAGNVELTGSPYLADYTGGAANCSIEFVVTDVKRVKTNVTAFGTNDAVKKSSSGGSDPVDPESILNMWVCALSGGVLGYAQFPGGNLSTDGVVIDFRAFGDLGSLYPDYIDFNKGRTATHEVGHWLNLRHIWGDSRCGNDYVSDTPQHQGANYGCPSTSDASMCKGLITKDLWMNYMDYTYDRCMYMFTQKQKERMDAAIAYSRTKYISATAPTSYLRYIVRR